MHPVLHVLETHALSAGRAEQDTALEKQPLVVLRGSEQIEYPTGPDAQVQGAERGAGAYAQSRLVITDSEREQRTSRLTPSQELCSANPSNFGIRVSEQAHCRLHGGEGRKALQVKRAGHCMAECSEIPLAIRTSPRR